MKQSKAMTSNEKILISRSRSKFKQMCYPYVNGCELRRSDVLESIGAQDAQT